MSHLTVLLGAGFSANAGFPLASQINARFNRCQKGKLLRISSSEWMWIDGKDSTLVHNGQMTTDVKYFSYLLDEVVREYTTAKGLFSDYEDFFNHININGQNQEWFEQMQDAAMNYFLKDHGFLDNEAGYNFLQSLKSTSPSRLLEIVNYLVADMLSVQVSSDIIEKHYTSFAALLKNFDSVSIYTLNHDLLLEKILTHFNIGYTRGFTKTDSDVYFEDSPLSVFRNDFSNATVKIYKLHGSIDYYRFNFDNFNEFVYFTTNGYRSKHFARRVDPKTGRTIQEMNSDIVPKFITGKDKQGIISNDSMYSVMFNEFQRDLASTENLLVSGYSFRDAHIDSELKKRKDIKIINQRNTKDYPYSGKIRNISSFDELKN